MDSEKATAVSPSSPLRARGPSVLDLLRGAAMTPAATSQARGVSPQPEDDQVPQERETQETGQFSLLAPPRQCACVRADTLIDNRFYSVFRSP